MAPKGCRFGGFRRVLVQALTHISPSFTQLTCEGTTSLACTAREELRSLNEISGPSKRPYEGNPARAYLAPLTSAAPRLVGVRSVRMKTTLFLGTRIYLE